MKLYKSDDVVTSAVEPAQTQQLSDLLLGAPLSADLGVASMEAGAIGTKGASGDVAATDGGRAVEEPAVGAHLADDVSALKYAHTSAAAADFDENCGSLRHPAPLWGQKFVTVGDWPLETPKSNPRVLSVMSFNVLAQVRCALQAEWFCV